MPTVLHVLPHAGGGGETYLRLLADMPGWSHERAVLSPSRSPVAAAALLPFRLAVLAARSRRADIVHVHGDTTAILALPLVRMRPGVITTHGLHLVRRINGWRRRLVVARLRRAAAAARAVICTSQAELDELARLGVERTRLVLVPNGIDLPAERVPKAREEARAALGISEGEVVALYLGQLEERKDPLTAVRAVEAAGDPRLRLLVAGDGPLLAEVLAAAGPATSVLGFRDDPDRLLLASDLFVMPSLREGASFAVLEAMGMGLPMVMSDGAGNPELVGDAGIVFPTGDVGALADAFRNLAADADARRRAGEAARARVAERFTRTGMRDAIQQVYVRALAPSRR